MSDTNDDKGEMRLLESRPKTQLLVTITRNLDEQDMIEVLLFGNPMAKFTAIADEIAVNDIRDTFNKPRQLAAVAPAAVPRAATARGVEGT